jgi:hypothetical protein
MGVQQCLWCFFGGVCIFCVMCYNLVLFFMMIMMINDDDESQKVKKVCLKKP